MIKVFFSYSHKDEELRNELETHLAALKRQGVIETWHDRRIGAGVDIDREIDQHLELADIILLLVSPYFIASDYCYDVEMKGAIERHSAGETVVIPVILHPCDWKGAPFGKLRATPTDGKPVSKFSNLHDAFLEITQDIRAVAKSIATEREIEISNTQVASNPIRGQVKKRPVGLQPRSGNLRVRKKFADLDRSRYVAESFEYMANYFENSLAELEARVAKINADFRRIDANTFTASIFESGDCVSSCKIWLSSDTNSSGEIRYSTSTSGNSWNESIHIEDDGYSMGLRAMGFHFMQQHERDKLLTKEGGAELFWSMLIGSLQ
ncbi:MAG: toll/interleukin-1 receptor domain-containing protein [Desulfobacteraceae bacterium]|nr:toll/interleukin-1 receptor domain-containing protein [Desulfobacteraceae bacterium]MBC2750191.1 toll/interleukin-1 receptor domain-containing protein [Desulfobacteraceae bacterium]